MLYNWRLSPVGPRCCRFGFGLKGFDSALSCAAVVFPPSSVRAVLWRSALHITCFSEPRSARFEVSMPVFTFNCYIYHNKDSNLIFFVAENGLQLGA